jgi:NADPH-dependent curcumin reductase CurA
MDVQTITLLDFLEHGTPGPENFSITSSSLDIETVLEEGSIIVQVLTISADPYLRMQIKVVQKINRKHYINNIFIF